MRCTAVREMGEEKKGAHQAGQSSGREHSSWSDGVVSTGNEWVKQPSTRYHRGTNP